ncbi:MAG: Uma2 family endonuclease [Acidimicrobiales bacterium]
MSYANPLDVMGLPAYLQWEEGQPARHELVGGRIYAMSGGTERHGLMVAYLFSLVAPAAYAAGCRPFTEGRRLKVPAGDLYYPDLLVVCGPSGADLYETDASFVVEVLSPSTRGTDRREKLRGYQTLRSIQAYALVEPDIRRIEIARWQDGEVTWTSFGAGDTVDTPYSTWELDAIYEAIDSMATF